MASTDPEVAKEAAQSKSPAKSDLPPPLPPATGAVNCSVVDVVLRVLLFSATLVAVIVMVTSEQSKLVPLPQMPTVSVKLPAKFNHSPAFIYFVAALAVACFYSIITTLASIGVILKPAFYTKFLLYFAFLDVLMLGIVASATGAAGGVAYVGLKGNRHVGWVKVCSTYDKFCRYIGTSTALALFAAVLLVLLSMLSTYSLYKRIR
ncbi:hypothetical protein ACOSP7_007402 [Xanthoceras sorbifolium]|uniref:CASP-like protein n=1 Tax=Xanthoceras sorbifolium TaxID=99658 RepID=A0ABQ8IAX6_9ROSI|nr:hypothetical protein JRO89_XS03G0181900 [Xanthoceras sorbifolium]